MTLRAVFLDVGGTLLTEREPRWEIYSRAARSRGVDIDQERMRELMHAAHHALPRELDGAFRYSDPWFTAFIHTIFRGYLGLTEDDTADVTRELFATFESADTFLVHDGAVELLAALRDRGLTVGVVSNWSARLPRLLEATGLAAHFDFVVCSALVGAEKPEPAIFELALERAGCAAHEALHVGDHARKDVAGARAVGLQVLRIDHDHRGGPEPREERVESLLELRERLCPSDPRDSA